MAQIEYIKPKGTDHQKKWHVRRPNTQAGRLWSFCGWYWSEGDAVITTERPEDICSLCLNRRDYKALVAEQESGE